MAVIESNINYYSRLKIEKKIAPNQVYYSIIEECLLVY